MKKLLQRLVPSGKQRWLVRADLIYCALTSLACFAMALLHRKMPDRLLYAHFGILGCFVGYSAFRLWRASQALKTARAELRRATVDLVHRLVESGTLDHDRDQPSLAEVVMVMQASSILHMDSKHSQLEIAMVDAWLAHWGIMPVDARDHKS